jgi:hypothetical protein
MAIAPKRAPGFLFNLFVSPPINIPMLTKRISATIPIAAYRILKIYL